MVERLGDLESIEHYGLETLQVGRRIVYDVKANWKLIIENFMECYHCATIHPELTEVLPEFADGYAAQYFVGHGAEFGADIQGFTVDGSEGVDRIPGVSDEQDRRYYAITIKPQVFINLVPDHVIFHRMYPMAADRTVVECDWLYLPDVVESGRDVSRVGRAVPPGQPAGLRRLRAVPAGHELTGLPRRRRPGAQRAPHRRVPPLGARPGGRRRLIGHARLDRPSPDRSGQARWPIRWPIRAPAALSRSSRSCMRLLSSGRRGPRR